MFKVNKESNRIIPVQIKTFGDLGFSERKHLQEWLAHEPNALGEELLIIQKEFDGFDDTRERLDLLALDKDGNLVIIENKLDDSGRDMVWQSLKYASYCATLTKAQIVDIYQLYLQRYAHQLGSQHESSTLAGNASTIEYPLNAAARICEFLDAADLDEVNLNLGNSQRIMLVAANFRKEVTSTALWLLGRGIDVRCFKVTPYALGEQLLINIDQIIPTPEAQEFMISISAKEAEEKNTDVVMKSRHNIRQEYWEKLLEAFQKSDCDLFDNISPSKDHWLSAGFGFSGCPLNVIFNKSQIRVELWLSRVDAYENKFIFDHLVSNRELIEQTFGDALEWMRLDEKKSCRIQFARAVDGFDKAHWNEYVAWHVSNMRRLENALKTPLKDAVNALKTQGLG